MYKSSTVDHQPPVGGTTLPPILAQSLPWLAGPAALQSANTMAGFGRVATEWVSFVHRRMGEDARLAGDLATSKSPAEFWGRYAEFLQKAALDYWNEYAALAGLSSEIMHAGVEASREPALAAQSGTSPVARAA
jgi:hypothetical protein